MVSPLIVDEKLLQRLLPDSNPNRSDRAQAWADWQQTQESRAVQRFITYKNDTEMPDSDIFQETLVTAYCEVENGKYDPRPGIPFSAYVKGIARNKIREARRKGSRTIPLDPEIFQIPAEKGIEPDHVYERSERRRQLRLGLEMLNPERKKVMEGYLAGKRPREIAKELSISEELVRQHKSRALRKLQKLKLGNLPLVK